VAGRLIIRYIGCLFPDGVVDLIELDGNPHGEYYKIHEDEIRDKYLECYGFTVIRFENRLVFQEPKY
jgi:very-short-patch-repair endonuclease